MAKVLFVGETWVNVTTEIKGFDSFTLTHYRDGSNWLRDALEKNQISVDHIPCHLAPDKFPFKKSELGAYDVVIFSDVGSNTLLLTRECTEECRAIPNRLEVIKEFVAGGGGFVMIGGWMSFQGIDGKAHYKYSPVEEILPATLLDGDDRIEVCSGLRPTKTTVFHPVTAKLPEEWPAILSYNKIVAKAKASVLATGNGDPLLLATEYGEGRTIAVAFDCAPHGAPFDFLNWEGYPVLWSGIVRWLAHEM